MKTTTKVLYALAAELGLTERSGEDKLHILVYGLTGKEHISELSDSEKKEVRKELEKMRRAEKCTPEMMTAAQQNKAWQLVYRLAELEPSNTAPAERLIGAIQKTLGITASRSNPFRWVNFSDGSKLIEQLKRYVKSAEKRQKRSEKH